MAYQNTRFGFTCNVPSDWHVVHEGVIRQQVFGRWAIVFGMPKVYCPVVKQEIEHSVSITVITTSLLDNFGFTLHGPIDTVESVIKFEEARRRSMSVEVTEAREVTPSPFGSKCVVMGVSQRGVVFLHKNVYHFCNGVGFFVNYVATADTFSLHESHYDAFLATLQVVPPDHAFITGSEGLDAAGRLASVSKLDAALHATEGTSLMIHWGLWRALKLLLIDPSIGSEIQFPYIGDDSLSLDGRLVTKQEDVAALLTHVSGLVGGTLDGAMWPTPEEVLALRAMVNTEVSVPVAVLHGGGRAIAVRLVASPPYGKLLILEQIHPTLVPTDADMGGLE